MLGDGVLCRDHVLLLTQVLWLLHVCGLHVYRLRRVVALGRNVKEHAMCGARVHTSLSWRRYNSTVADHSLHNSRGHLLGVPADLGTPVAMCVDAGPDEQRKVQAQAEELAYNARQGNAKTVRLLSPELVDKSVLLSTVLEMHIRGKTQSARAIAGSGDVACVLLPNPGVVGSEYIVTTSAGGVIVVPAIRTAIQAEIIQVLQGQKRTKCGKNEGEPKQ